MKATDLCGACAAKLGTAYYLIKVSGGVDHKVTCAECGRRRYGGSYERGPRKKKKEANGGAV